MEEERVDRRDKVIRELAFNGGTEVNDAYAFLAAERILNLEDQISALQDALMDFGQHAPGCSGTFSNWPCTCGWKECLKDRALVPSKGL